MKTALFVLCLLCTTAALGQSAASYSTLNSEPQMVEFFSHPQHAARQPMAQEQNLQGSPGYFYARGERPLWEVAEESPAMALGDIARILRKEHAAAKKADVVWQN